MIEESADFDGVPVVLYDTAGLRDAGDEVERIGVERARSVAAERPTSCCWSSTHPAARSQRRATSTGARRPIAVLNKIDLPCRWSAHEIDAAGPPRTPIVRVSATAARSVLTNCGAVTQRASTQWSRSPADADQR